ncbi:MAG: hypothetical protein COV67_14955 [Nitrospinae bacterium CG11_big_fil_rev_8_21_14_0_20_56_8]|nr:MAG: hypothetical protein COV67_14955 [Nitrospinae bacterium CG11_big_fil_rev_8_21_14_0_20_56_8]
MEFSEFYDIIEFITLSPAVPIWGNEFLAVFRDFFFYNEMTLARLPDMNQPIKLVIPSDAKFLSLSRKVLQQLFACQEVPSEIARKLVLCVDEACSNIIKYSYEGDPNQTIELSFWLKDDQFTVKIRDYGKQCDTSTFKPRCLDDVKPGGLGTYFIHEIMDQVSYCTEREQGTLLTMTKHFKNETAPAAQQGQGKP